MGNYVSTTGVQEKDYKVEIVLKKRNNLVKYIISDGTQLAKKEVTNPTGTVMIFDVDLITHQLTYHGMACGDDGDFMSLQEALLSMVKEIRECVDIEQKPSCEEEMDE